MLRLKFRRCQSGGFGREEFPWEKSRCLEGQTVPSAGPRVSLKPFLNVLLTGKDRSMSFIPASQVSPRPVEWLWPGRIALGKIALLEGDPELGKTWVTCDL